ncbi:MAG TPA: hypothetical protein PLL09_10205 [Flavobacterium sp.]|uniref:hypothetical protein n=1 Tax=unclassified Flavobacterium TaxID=196869 RepID=UPI000E7ECE6C|nr:MULTISPECIES: hypothetical protein [unclassified Flavobacterium]HBI00857.1 hypothetical protein [Flavobacterium sp.]HRE78183.1 hypothetical protein [Flavobacterium sp.]
MNKNVILASVFTTLFLISCGKKEEQPADTIIIEQPSETPAPAPAEPVEQDGTSLEIGKDGVKINTKDGDNKTTIDVSDKDAKLEIKD